MSNPSHILLDSDALIQLFMVRQGGLLARLRERCGVLPSVVPQVEQEVRWHSKFRHLYEPNVHQAVAAGNLVVLDGPKVRSLLLARGTAPENIDVQIQALTRKSNEYSLHVGDGEAHTHAVATALNLPVISNDNQALEVLAAQGKQAAGPTLRLFDLIVFAFDCGWLDESACENVRSTLLSKKEYVPAQFRSKDPFSTARTGFSCRISTTALAAPASTPDGHLHLEQRAT